MHRYEIIIFWSDEDEAFVADVPGCSGFKAHGNTPQGALTNVQEAIDLWVDIAREFGDPVPKPKGSRLIYARYTIWPESFSPIW